MKLPANSEPWHEPVEGPLYYLLVDELTCAALAEGYVLLRLQRQAQNLIHYLGATDDHAGANPARRRAARAQTSGE